MPFGMPGKVFRSPMPFGKFDYGQVVWSDYLDNKICLVVILVEEDEFLVEAGRDLSKFYRSEGLEVIDYPITDFQTPLNKETFLGVINEVLSHAENGENVAVHCLAGIGRTGLFMACMAKQNFHISGQEAIEWVRKSLPGAVESSIQERFILDF